MADQLKRDLQTLRIDESQELSKKFVTMKYKKLAKEKHPDRKDGNTCEFQELQNAYKRIIKHIEDEQKKEEFEDDDDDFETRFFMKHNMMKECSTSYVIYIQEEFVDHWKTIYQSPNLTRVD